jgi:hypothetical protein
MLFVPHILRLIVRSITPCRGFGAEATGSTALVVVFAVSLAIILVVGLIIRLVVFAAAVPVIRLAAAAVIRACRTTVLVIRVAGIRVIATA